MASEWFCKISGTQVGPLSSQQLKAFADEGRLRREDLVRQGADGPWVAAVKVKGLFGNGPPPAAKTSDPGKAAKPKSSRAGSQPPPPPPAQQSPVAGVMPVVTQPIAGVPVGYTVRAVSLAPVAGAVPQVGLPVGYAVQSVPPPVVIAPTVLAGRPPGVGADDKTIPGLVVGDVRGKTPEKGDLEVRRRRKSNAPMYIVSICGTILVVGGGLGLVYVLKEKPTVAKAAAAAKANAGEGQGEAEKKPAVLDLDDLDVNRAKKPAAVADAGAAASSAAEKSESPPPPSEWHDVTKGSLPYKSGDIDVTLKIDPVQLGRPPVSVMDPKTMKPIDRVLIFTVTIENASQAKPVDLKPFSSQLQPKALVDEQNTSYRPVRYGSPQAIGPGKNGADKVAFEPPAESAKSLRLTLPAEAFGGQGPLKFEIPTSIITQAPQPAPEPVAGTPARPAAKPEKEGLLHGDVLRRDKEIPPIDLMEGFDAKPLPDKPAKEDKDEKTRKADKPDVPAPAPKAEEAPREGGAKKPGRREK